MIEYLKKFPTRADYEEYISGTYEKPLTAYIEATGETIFQEEEQIEEVKLAKSQNIKDAATGSGDFNVTSLKTYITELNFPNGATTTNSWEGCTNLTSVTIPDSVTSIPTYAFRSTGITTATLPENVTYISSYVFDNCPNLTHITILATTPPRMNDTYLFGYNVHKPIYVPAESIDTYKSAQYWAFYRDDFVAIPE